MFNARLRPITPMPNTPITCWLIAYFSRGSDPSDMGPAAHATSVRGIRDGTGRRPACEPSVDAFGILRGRARRVAQRYQCDALAHAHVTQRAGHGGRAEFQHLTVQLQT